ncbi:hypothetical protein RE476_11630 [Methanolobus mangrovi]|uniref:Uncharacterized protein n=1 Tax=Methanolobus mangrovi TaxID=3072977 RepID=A0AA51YGH2_9EURY|nr:hypothetical protein [Methanolobus mangrovi]WMW22007.1 hypothetical protein RE476_11630 [Methanolobus mangrovi]
MKKGELVQYLVGKRKNIDFSKPAFSVERQDPYVIMQRILSISYSDRNKMRFSKDVLHYMEKNAGADKLFTLNDHVRERMR